MAKSGTTQQAILLSVTKIAQLKPLRYPNMQKYIIEIPPQLLPYILAKYRSVEAYIQAVLFEPLLQQKYNEELAKTIEPIVTDGKNELQRLRKKIIIKESIKK